ncbi:hypothetical protein ppKF707_4931 [Metapseudomonas furukawaii]|uniref:Uncharacterized protein n=2 Tax=Metapseudomonas furukawaii TaxID=1149133 RepID=L8MBJ8_METFU|nr:hypothetical protein ppKF707_2250 [Pseudomonas furukawaii]ELS27559.1 hypothetical protein ppKF707_4931 [Pseudomonas furukawaii]BAU77394.1 hypothetical protein KF707C_p50 [Pseudomonas furukawaii]
MKAGDDPMAQSNSAPPVVASDLPTVTGVSGVSGRLVATFRYPNGGTASASSGTEIAGGFVVSEVSLNRVVLTKGDRRFPLQSGVVTQQPTQQQPLLPGQFPTLSQPPVAIPAQ